MDKTVNRNIFYLFIYYILNIFITRRNGANRGNAEKKYKLREPQFSPRLLVETNIIVCSFYAMASAATSARSLISIFASSGNFSLCKAQVK